MTKTLTKYQLVMAVFPSTRGFGFTVFEGPLRPVDWGVKIVSDDKNSRSLEKVEKLVELYKPDVIVVEDYKGEGSRRAKRIEELVNDIVSLAKEYDIAVECYSRANIRSFFSRYGAVNKYEIAKTIAGWISSFETSLPPPRKIWESEHHRMALFDAASLALTHFYFSHKEAA